MQLFVSIWYKTFLSINIVLYSVYDLNNKVDQQSNSETHDEFVIL